MLSSSDTQTQCCKTGLLKMHKHPSPYFINTVNKLEEHCNDLNFQRKCLTNKVSTIEKSIPAIMACSMFVSAADCTEPPLCKIRQILNEWSSYPDPTDKLIEDLKNAAQAFNQETEELHEKIINIDIEIEEEKMKLESLTYSNEELLKKIEDFERELEKNTVPSLHSIRSEDLCCLNKIRQLGEHELELKNRMKELEEKEVILNEKMHRILDSRNIQKPCDCHKKYLCQKGNIITLKPCICMSAAKSGLKCEAGSCLAGCKRINPCGGSVRCQTQVCCASSNFMCKGNHSGLPTHNRHINKKCNKSFGKSNIEHCQFCKCFNKKIEHQQSSLKDKDAANENIPSQPEDTELNNSEINRLERNLTLDNINISNELNSTNEFKTDELELSDDAKDPDSDEFETSEE